MEMQHSREESYTGKLRNQIQNPPEEQAIGRAGWIVRDLERATDHWKVQIH